MQPANPPIASDFNLPLYSKRAILIFSALFSTIAGGAMMAQNLRDIDQPAAARTALWGSIGYTLLLLWATSILPGKGGGTFLPFLIGYAGSWGLEAYFSKFLANRDSFPVKSIRKPLLICLVIFTPIVALVLYAVAYQPTV